METKEYQTLREIDVKPFMEKKGNLIYLSWAKAWDLLKQQYPNAQYTIYENENGYPYFTDGKWVWVKVGVTIQDLEHKIILPVMNNMNKSIPLEMVDMNSINKAIMRCLTKAIAMHGIGLSLYIGEDLQETNSKKFF